jgi:hypothetical protein
MKTNAPLPNFVIGKSTANGLTSFSDGDIFVKDGKIYRLCGGSYGWTLRETLACDGYRTDYIAPPLDGWVELPSALHLSQKLNDAVAASGICLSCGGDHPSGCCSQDGDGG